MNPVQAIVEHEVDICLESFCNNMKAVSVRMDDQVNVLYMSLAQRLILRGESSVMSIEELEALVSELIELIEKGLDNKMNIVQTINNDSICTMHTNIKRKMQLLHEESRQDAQHMAPHIDHQLQLLKTNMSNEIFFIRGIISQGIPRLHENIHKDIHQLCANTSQVVHVFQGVINRNIRLTQEAIDQVIANLKRRFEQHFLRLLQDNIRLVVYAPEMNIGQTFPSASFESHSVESSSADRDPAGESSGVDSDRPSGKLPESEMQATESTRLAREHLSAFGAETSGDVLPTKEYQSVPEFAAEIHETAEGLGREHLGAEKTSTDSIPLKVLSPDIGLPTGYKLATCEPPPEYDLCNVELKTGDCSYTDEMRSGNKSSAGDVLSDGPPVAGPSRDCSSTGDHNYCK